MHIVDVLSSTHWPIPVSIAGAGEHGFAMEAIIPPMIRMATRPKIPPRPIEMTAR